MTQSDVVPRIVWEDNYVAAVYKPRGWVTTREGKTSNTVEALSDWVGRKGLVKIDTDQNEENTSYYQRFGIVHRLDKGTSGVILVAKTWLTFKKLQHQFAHRQVKKNYWAVVQGLVTVQGCVKAPIERSKHRFGSWQVGIEGKAAETEFTPLGRGVWRGSEVTLLSIYPKTGRTHQIRVHMAYLGWPILGDRVYGCCNKEANKPIFLHAAKVQFLHPWHNKPVEVSVLWPDELRLWWAEMSKTR